MEGFEVLVPLFFSCRLAGLKGIGLLIGGYVHKAVQKVGALVAGDKDCKYLCFMDNETRQKIADLVNILHLQDCISDLPKFPKLL